MAIKAPFNFVPVSDKIFFPDWANQISHDIPFSDGISGTIELKIIAESPIFVRNGHTALEASEKTNSYKSFSNIDGKYFIPGSSIKGAIRNVFEIMSFGKMQFVDNKRYSIRDLQLRDYTSTFQNAEIRCGWMRKEGNRIIISDRGVPFRVSHKKIDDYFNTQFCETFEDPNFFRTESNKSSTYKYEVFKNKELVVKFNQLPNSKNTVDKRKFVSLENNGKHQGTIVFTGQASRRQKSKKKASGKFFEFVFSDNEKKTYEFDFYEREGKFSDFQFIYKDSTEWSFWKKKMLGGEQVPVFFIFKDDDLQHIGLSYLYKLPFPKKIKDYLPEEHSKVKMDLADCVFGTTDNKSLKGRISFSNAFAQQSIVLPENLVYMGSPKPTYYPIYLKQKGVNGYLDDKSKSFVTMLHNKAELKGWKRYPIRDTYIKTFEIPEGQSENANPFIALNRGSKFYCQVRFFNLKPEELGGLVKSIELEKNSYHILGFAKSYGYGKVKVSIESINSGDSIEKGVVIQKFDKLMSEKIEGYSKTKQLKELNVLMQSNNLTTQLEYMELKDFVDYKKHNPKRNIYGQYLQYLSDYVDNPKVIEQKLEGEAIVTLVAGSIIQAKLIEGNDTTPKDLSIPLGKHRPKKGTEIKVKIIVKGGNIKSLELIS
jgi:CRISPR-associated protein (TIGR03986 family)